MTPPLSNLFARKAPAPLDSLAFVFCHIPRTGGSSIWHQMAQLASNGLNIYDLFHETNARYDGNLNLTRATLSEDSNKLATPMDYRLVVHHHVHIRIGDLFQKRRPVYFTYLRDPLARFISDLRWNVRLFNQHGNFFDQDINRDKWIPYLSGEKPLSELLHDEALLQPYLSFYLNWFWGLMHRDTNTTLWKPAFTQAEKLEILEFVRANFVLIGFESEIPSNKMLSLWRNGIAKLGLSERARYCRRLAAMLKLESTQLSSQWHYGGTVSREIDIIPGLSDPAFLHAIKSGMKEDYWLIQELRSIRLNGLT